MRTEQVPEAFRNDCLPGFSHLYLSGNAGYLLIQSVTIDGIGMHYLRGDLMTEYRVRVSLSPSAFAIWILLDGMIFFQEKDGSLTTIRHYNLCLGSRIHDMSLRTAKKGGVGGVLLLYPPELIASILSFYPRLNDLRTSFEDNKRIFSVHAHTGAALLETLYTLTHIPFIPSMEPFYKQTMTETAHRVFSSLSSDTPETPVSLHDIACIHKAKEYIDEHLSTHFSIRQIARHAGINQSKLKTGFREVYGAGLYGYLREQRLTAARTALLETRLTLKEISRRASYKSVSNFCTAYKRHFGVTPGQLRKQKGRM